MKRVLYLNSDQDVHLIDEWLHEGDVGSQW